MSLSVKFTSRQVEITDDGTVTTLCWTGGQNEIDAFSREIEPGSSDDNGSLTSCRIYQESPKIWVCERKYLRDRDGLLPERPNTVYGKKSAQLHGAMLSLPIEKNKNYKTHWNYYLAGSPKVAITDIPEWWETATDTIMTVADSQKYRWVQNPSECPSDADGMWRPIKNPKYPGTNSYDVATYTITETAKFSSARAAGKMIANVLNKIGKPNEDFNLTPPGYNWKCDNAEVSYNGKAWFATMTWTRSGEDHGWIQEIYGGLDE